MTEDERSPVSSLVAHQCIPPGKICTAPFRWKLSTPVVHCTTETKSGVVLSWANSDPVHTGPDPYGHHINLKSLKTSMTLKFVVMLQNLIKAYYRKSGKSKYDRKLTELDVETTRIRSRVNGVWVSIVYLSCPMSISLRVLRFPFLSKISTSLHIQLLTY